METFKTLQIFKNPSSGCLRGLNKRWKTVCEKLLTKEILYNMFSKHGLSFPKKSFNFVIQNLQKKWKMPFSNAGNIRVWTQSSFQTVFSKCFPWQTFALISFHDRQKIGKFWNVTDAKIYSHWQRLLLNHLKTEQFLIPVFPNLVACKVPLLRYFMLHRL